MERRVLLAISLSFVVLFLYQSFLAPPPSQGPSGGQAQPPAQTTSATPGTPATPAPATSQTPALEPTATVLGDSEARSIVVETARVRATFSNRGGRLEGWELKDYWGPNGEPLNLIPAAVAQAPVEPFSLRTDEAQVTADLNNTLYRVSGVDGTQIDGRSGPTTITFEVETSGSVRARKVFRLEPDSYVITFSASVERGGQPLNARVDWGAGLGDHIAQMPPGSFLSANYTHPAQAIFQRDGSVTRVPHSSLGAGLSEGGQFGFAGIDDLYFVAMVIKPPAPIDVQYTPLSLPDPANPAVIGQYVAWSVRFPQSPIDAQFYVGPKQLDVLRAVDPELTRVIHFGIFAWLAAPLLGALKWVNGFIGNYGWSIVILTILINLAMWPLRHKSVVSMRRMQELQPQMKAIQERYAKYKITDPERQKMNQEVMDLYKAKGVNPASGCVPMLLTMPFLFAFYSMLSQAIEIRGASFLGWINDLSAADPLYITPVLMGITMFWQQKLTPTTADPSQQRVMMIMPFMFTAMSFGFPSGLVIYWLVSNLWAIGQQYVTNYLIGPPAVHNVRPSVERRAKTEKGA
jgi:YidC/Oxa1 family membrane protein insertase